MGLDDKLVLLTIGVGTAAFAWFYGRRGVRGRRLFTALWSSFYGLVLTVMMAAHCLEILYHTLAGHVSFDGTPFVYGWRVYSLLLFGVLLIWLGVGCLRAALGLSRGEAAARPAMLRLLALVLALVVPLIPIHPFFGYLMSGVSAVTLAVVVLTARERSPWPLAVGA